MQTTSASRPACERPNFSVITPSFNQERYIVTNVESVLEQRYPGVEHVIIDNASTDGTLSALQKFPSLKVVSERDKGQSDAVNKGIALSSNEWIVWVNSDDFLLPDALEKIATYIKAHPHVSVIISNIIQTDADGRITSCIAPAYTRWRLRHWWWSGTPFLWQPGTIIHRRVFEKVGLLDVGLHYGMDFDFFLRAHDHFAFSYLNANLVAFRRHGDQKGHASEEPFNAERMTSTLNYWRGRGAGLYCFYRVICFFAAGSLNFIEGLRQYERGNHKAGLRLIRKGLLRNPAGVLRPEHFGYWLRKAIGRERYYSMRSRTK